MPNHLTTVCTLTGPAEDIARFIGAHIHECERHGETAERFEFESIVPMPQSIKDTIRPMGDAPVPDGVPAEPVGDGPVELYAASLLEDPGANFSRGLWRWVDQDVHTWGDVQAWLDKKYPSARFWGQRVVRALEETGCPGWYEWCVEHWGTKWGAYAFRRRGQGQTKLVFEFDTAWLFPGPIFVALTKLYPECTFEVVTIDEGGPEYEGHYEGPKHSFCRVPPSHDRYRMVYGEDPPRGVP